MNGRLLIVEDQTFFRKGLRKMIEDNAIGWRVVGEAENGREALDYIKEEPPDLVITDIRMPGMDGIELAEHIHSNRFDVDLIILTGYEDFSYAQAALRYGAIDFLIKPCNEETLLGVLQKAYEHFLAKRQQEQQLLEAKRAKDEALLRSLILRLPHKAAEAERLFERCRDRRLLFVFVPSYYPEGKRYRPRDLGLLQFALFNIVSELMEQFQLRGQSVPLEYDRFALLLEDEYPEGFTSSAEQNALSCLGIAITVCSFGTITMPDDLPEKYDRFRESLSLPAGQGRVPAAGLAGVAGLDNQSRVKELQVQFSADIALGRVDMLQGSLNSAIERLTELPIEDAKMEAVTLVFALNAAARQSFDTRDENSGYLEKIERLPNAKTPLETAEWVKDAMNAFLVDYTDWKEGKSQNIIKKALDFLDNHYMESCSLKEIGQRFHISTAYLSKLIKKETGDNFSTYLTKIRMQKAAMLLLNTEMKVFEIASSVGYDDPNYFTNVFRMIHKLSPSDYRKQKR